MYSDISRLIQVAFGLYNYKRCTKWWPLASRHSCEWWATAWVTLAKVSNEVAAQAFSILSPKGHQSSRFHSVVVLWLNFKRGVSAYVNIQASFSFPDLCANYFGWFYICWYKALPRTCWRRAVRVDSHVTLPQPLPPAIFCNTIPHRVFVRAAP